VNVIPITANLSSVLVDPLGGDHEDSMVSPIDPKTRRGVIATIMPLNNIIDTLLWSFDRIEEVTIGLVGEAVYLAKETIAKTVHGVGFPPLPELIDKVVKGNVPVFV